MKSFRWNGSQHQNKKVRNRGFTLLEALIALGLTGLLTTMAVAATLQVKNARELLKGRVAAMVLGASKFAELQSGSEQASSGNFAEPYSGYRWYAHEETTENNVKRIIITINWGKDYSYQKSFYGYRLSE